MSESLNLSDDIPFTLSCADCDVDSPHSYDAAVQSGWTRIQFTPDGWSENYLGLCPECSAARNAAGRSDSNRVSCLNEKADHHVEIERQESPGA